MTHSQPTFERRIQLQKRPNDMPVMRQSWEKLLFLHWRFEPKLIQAILPAGLTVDTYDGSAWVGIVPFYMRKIHPVWSPTVPYLSNFLEVNLRTYAYDARGTPGVWFISLEANRWLAVLLGRSWFHLPYWWGKLTAREEPENWIDYHCYRRSDPEQRTSHFRYRGIGPAATAIKESLEFFLVERYILFAELHSQGIVTGQVHHPPYQIRTAEVSHFSDSLFTLAGLPEPRRPPDHALFTEGVDVEVFGLKKVH